MKFWRMHQEMVFMCSVVHPEFFGPLRHYQPRDTVILETLKDVVPSTWSIQKTDIWYHCRPPRVELPHHGWKIHVSVNWPEIRSALERAGRICVENQTAFKVAVDLFVSGLLCSKLWPRPGAGKLITIYPSDESRFIDLIDKVYRAMQGFQGPYVLSDRRYKDSRSVYYRYGGFAQQYALNVYGEKEPVIVFQGENFSDKRTPYFKLPPWVTDPFEMAGVRAHGG